MLLLFILSIVSLIFVDDTDHSNQSKHNETRAVNSGDCSGPDCDPYKNDPSWTLDREEELQNGVTRRTYSFNPAGQMFEFGGLAAGLVVFIIVPILIDIMLLTFTISILYSIIDFVLSRWFLHKGVPVQIIRQEYDKCPLEMFLKGFWIFFIFCFCSGAIISEIFHCETNTGIHSCRVFLNLIPWSTWSTKTVSLFDGLIKMPAIIFITQIVIIIPPIIYFANSFIRNVKSDPGPTSLNLNQ